MSVVAARTRVAPTGRERTFSKDEVIVSKTDLTGKITYANRVFVRVSGYSEEELLGAILIAALAGGDREVHRDPGREEALAGRCRALDERLALGLERWVAHARERPEAPCFDGDTARVVLG